jgi:hypothetical protein
MSYDDVFQITVELVASGVRLLLLSVRGGALGPAGVGGTRLKEVAQPPYPPIVDITAGHGKDLGRLACV